MQKLILLKYGELTTKKENIGLFLSTLKKNLIEKLKDFPVEINYDKGRMFITAEESILDIVIEKVRKIFGIHEITLAYKTEDATLEGITILLKNIIKDKDFKTFKVETKRSDKSFPISSIEVSKYLGGVILKEKENSKVDVHHPKTIVNVEIRKNAAYIYYETLEGLGGYPVGTLGKGILMLSGGIDSPVAGYLAMKRGVKLEALYFESPPHTSIEAKNKVKELAKILKEYQGSMKLHVIHFTEIQEAIYKNIPHEYLITIMRRMMYRIASKICYNRRAHIIVNGESIGQVASQTLTSMKAINEVIKTPVIRPVACFDKLEIIELAKKIGTYETSILPFEDCCTIFVPDHPVINPVPSLCEEYEKRIPYEEMIYKAIKNHEIIDIKEEKEYQDLL